MRTRKLFVAVAVLLVGVVPSSDAVAKPKLLCPQWKKLALRVGFSSRDYGRLDYIIWRESRCAPRAVNTNFHRDGLVTRDWGLTQVNDFSWITFLRNRKIVTKSAQLLNPKSNLRAAYALYDYSKETHGNPWLQWEK